MGVRARWGSDRCRGSDRDVLRFTDFCAGAVVQRCRATASPSAPSLAAPTATTVSNPAGLVREFANFQTGLHARVGVVVRAVGTGSVAPVALGGLDFADQPAWSTIKVPLVIASCVNTTQTIPQRR